MQIEETHTALQSALDTLDNFEACNKLTEEELANWSFAREKLLEAMGSMVACEMRTAPARKISSADAFFACTPSIPSP